MQATARQKLERVANGQSPDTIEIMSPAQVCRLMGVSRYSLWKLQSDPTFPAVRQLTERRTGYVKAEIVDYLNKYSMLPREQRPVLNPHAKERGKAMSYTP
ncbi:AlpA family phage regulatory protein, partial [Arthrospira platensis SPKY1]|nr:AlpA family phage regulatory protein [Arthrospira platensis SPKY1]